MNSPKHQFQTPLFLDLKQTKRHLTFLVVDARKNKPYSPVPLKREGWRGEGDEIGIEVPAQGHRDGRQKQEEVLWSAAAPGTWSSIVERHCAAEVEGETCPRPPPPGPRA